MQCYRCEGRGRSFERVAVDRATGELLGALCERCEAELSRDDSADDFMGTCVNCRRSADLVFPQWDSILEDEDGAITDVEYTVRLTTLATCTSCLTRSARALEGRPSLDDYARTR